MSNAPKLSLTFRVDSGVLEHNNRSFKAKNVDASRTSDNITYKSENIEEKYHELFDKALDEYNARKRSNEKIPDYYEHIRKGKQEKPFYEVVVQFGDVGSCGLKSENWETAKQMLSEQIAKNCYVVGLTFSSLMYSHSESASFLKLSLISMDGFCKKRSILSITELSSINML